VKRLATAIAAIALIGTPAFAADMAVKAPPPPPAPVFSWTGWYVGGNVGYSWGSASNDFAFSQTVTFNGSEREHLDGVIGGAGRLVIIGRRVLISMA
jgi:outer membrane immunogenic protein